MSSRYRFLPIQAACYLLGVILLAGCQSPQRFEISSRLGWLTHRGEATETSPPEIGQVQQLPEFQVTGHVRNPGLFVLRDENQTIRHLITAAGDIQYPDGEAVFVAIERRQGPVPITHYIPADILNHPLISKIRIRPDDAIRVVSVRQTTLGRPGVRGQTLEAIKAEGRIQSLARIHVWGTDETVDLIGRSPRLEDLKDRIAGPSLSMPLVLISRTAKELGRSEIYYLPTSEKLVHGLSDRPASSKALDVVQVLSRGFLRDGDSVKFSLFQTAPLVVETLLQNEWIARHE